MIDYDGAHVIDSEGEDIGTVERTFAGDRGDVQFVEVKLGSLFAKHRMVPAGDVDLQDDGLHVPYDKGVIVSSPDVSEIRDRLDGSALDTVRAFYESAPIANASDDESAEVASPTDADAVSTST